MRPFGLLAMLAIACESDTTTKTFNDNPSIDMGVEDLHSGNMLYQQIMGTMLRKLDELNGR